MNQLRGIVKSFFPIRTRRFIRAAHRDLVFQQAMRKFLANPEACTNPQDPILKDLIYGWGNNAWSAQNEYLVACIEHALTTNGPILECGSGLSTLLVGAIAKWRHLSYWSLEHTPEWAAKVQKNLKKYKIETVVLCATALKDYGDYSWYNPPLGSMPDKFSLVICDGPPARTKGGRFGLVPIMGEKLRPGCVILLDDAEREQERAIAERWKMDLGASYEVLGNKKPYIKMTTNRGRSAKEDSWQAASVPGTKL